MKIYISADIEGVSGVVHREHTVGSSAEYERARRLMTGEVNAAILGAAEAGAGEILVNDSHGSMRNIIIEELRPEARLITGYPRSLSMMEGIDRTFDGTVFVGYHSMAGSKGVLAHTMSGFAFSTIEINGVAFGETEINAAIAGYYGVPVLAVSGDSCLREEVGRFLPGVEFAEVKTARGSRVADCLSPVKARELIREKVKNAVTNISKYKTFAVEGSIELKAVVNQPYIADVLEIIPGLNRISPVAVAYKAGDMVTVMRMISTMMCAASVLMIDIHK